MKQKIKIILIAFFIFLSIPLCNQTIYATDTQTATSQEDILKGQQDSLNISSFIKETQKYTQDTFEDLDMGELFSAAITGNIDNETIFKTIQTRICNLCIINSRCFDFTNGNGQNWWHYRLTYNIIQ